MKKFSNLLGVLTLAGGGMIPTVAHAACGTTGTPFCTASSTLARFTCDLSNAADDHTVEVWTDSSTQMICVEVKDLNGNTETIEELDLTSLTVQPDGSTPLALQIVGTDQKNTIDLGPGVQDLFSPDASQFSLEANVKAQDGNDEIYGSDATSASGQKYSESLEGEDGEDTIESGNGDDVLVGGADHDTLRGGDGDDELSGNGGSDKLEGGPGDDLLFGHDGNDVLCGSSYGSSSTGDDELYGAAGLDCLDAGVGSGLGGQVIDCGTHSQDTYRPRYATPLNCEYVDNTSDFCDF